MERWRDRVAVVTGASSGIGAAILTDLAKAGVIVVGLSRHPDRIRSFDLTPEAQSRVHPVQCDVTVEEAVKDTFKWVEDNLGGTDILVNCAGVFYQGRLIDEHLTPQIKETFDVEIMGTLFCTREAFQSMQRRNFDGHVVNINSVDGHHVVNLLQFDTNFCTNYAAAKFALTAMTEVYRQEFANAGTKVKISSVSPGLTNTTIGDHFISMVDMPVLNPADVSNAVLYCLGTPPHVQVHELIIKPIGEVF
ncbi:farnesol dehydrogenase-like isoform X2 [Hermetia illucens]|uniref:farnesol dehydrogenase-like isoform X2 n=1 Tax=Hermetia illucens TaxID=343691 RepID=UPI0018CC3906|nr:farnesol dehydrogenase-like isoform X2 [Hermetia illucens]